MFKINNKNKEANKTNDLKSELLDLTIKTNCCYLKSNEVLHRLNEIESKINVLITKNIKSVIFERFSLMNMQKEFNELSSKKLALSSYIITYIAESKGFLDIDCDTCEITVSDSAQITIRNSLKNFYLDKNDVIHIKNPKNLKNITFRKLEK